jgi:uncharacterized protein
MITLPKSDPLTDEELDEIDSLLARVRGAEIPNAEALDGFLTALAVCPELIMPSEYMQVVMRGETEDDDLVFEDMAEAERFYGLLARHWNAINAAFRKGEFYMPRLAEDEDGNVHGNDWANGFLKGTHLRHSIWEKVANSDERGGPFVPIWALAYEHADDPSLRPYDHPIEPEQRERLLAGLIAGLKQLYDGFEKEREAGTGSTSTFRRSEPKIGRNAPCPCGAGKKYKNCCGRVTLH